MTNDILVKKIVGKQRVLDNIIEMINEATIEVNMTMRYWGIKWGTGQMQEDMDFFQFKESITDAVQKGISVKILGSIEGDTASNIKEIKKTGASLKYIEPSFLRFIICDNKKLLVATSESYTQNLHYYYAIVSENSDIIEFFKDYFNNLWKMSKEIDDLMH